MKTIYTLCIAIALLTLTAGCKKAITCYPPSSMSVSGSNSQLTVTCSDFYVYTTAEYGPAGFTRGQGTKVKLGHSGGSITGLTVGQIYDVFLQGSCEDGSTSDWGSRGSATVVDYSNCDIPTDPSDASSTYNDYVFLDWNYYHGSSSTVFEVQYGPAGFTTGQGTSAQVTGTSFTTGTYVVGTTYDFMVRAKCGDGGWSQWSPRHTFQAISTNGHSPVCAAPTNVLTSVSGSSATITWDQNGQSQWDVGLSINSNVEPSNISTQYNTTAYYTGIYGGTDYYIYVRSVCSGSSRSAWTIKHFTR